MVQLPIRLSMLHPACISVARWRSDFSVGLAITGCRFDVRPLYGSHAICLCYEAVFWYQHIKLGK